MRATLSLKLRHSPPLRPFKRLIPRISFLRPMPRLQAFFNLVAPVLTTSRKSMKIQPKRLQPLIKPTMPMLLKSQSNPLLLLLATKRSRMIWSATLKMLKTMELILVISLNLPTFLSMLTLRWNPRMSSTELSSDKATMSRQSNKMRNSMCSSPKSLLNSRHRRQGLTHQKLLRMIKKCLRVLTLHLVPHQL